MSLNTWILQTTDAMLHVQEGGDPERPTLIFLHGFPDDHEIWSKQMQALSLDFHVVTFDMRGVGQSILRAPIGEAYLIDNLMHDIEAVIQNTAQGRPVHLIGHDWGSVLGWSFIANPKYQPLVQSWTSISGPHVRFMLDWVKRYLFSGSPRKMKMAWEQIAHSWYIYAFQLPGIPELPMQWLPVALLRFAEQKGGIDASDPQLATLTPEKARSRMLNAVNLYRQNLRKLPESIGLGSIHTPTQLIIPELDEFVRPQIYDDVHNFVTDLEINRLYANHWVQRSHPEQINTLIRRFVDSIETRPNKHDKQLKRA